MKSFLMKISLIMCIVISLVACQADDHNDLINYEEQTEPSNREEQTPLQKAEIHVMIPKDTGFSVPVSKIPMLYDYLSQSTDLEIEVDRVRTWWIGNFKDEDYFVIGYGCGAKMCNLLLIRHTDKKVDTLELPFAIYQAEQFSPAGNRIAVKLGTNDGQINRSALVFVDLEQWELMPQSQLSEPIWSIADDGWVDNDTFTYVIPDVPSSEYTVIEEWYAMEVKQYKEVKLMFNAD